MEKPIKPSARKVKTVVQDTSEERVEIPKITFEAYVRENKVHPGLVASFCYEEGIAGNDIAGERTSEEWKVALETQANRTYS